MENFVLVIVMKEKCPGCKHFTQIHRETLMKMLKDKKIKVVETEFFNFIDKGKIKNAINEEKTKFFNFSGDNKKLNPNLLSLIGWGPQFIIWKNWFNFRDKPDIIIYGQNTSQKEGIRPMDPFPLITSENILNWITKNSQKSNKSNISEEKLISSLSFPFVIKPYVEDD